MLVLDFFVHCLEACKETKSIVCSGRYAGFCKNGLMISSCWCIPVTPREERCEMPHSHRHVLHYSFSETLLHTEPCFWSISFTLREDPLVTPCRTDLWGMKFPHDCECLYLSFIWEDIFCIYNSRLIFFFQHCRHSSPFFLHLLLRSPLGPFSFLLCSSGCPSGLFQGFLLSGFMPLAESWLMSLGLWFCVCH